MLSFTKDQVLVYCVDYVTSLSLLHSGSVYDTCMVYFLLCDVLLSLILFMFNKLLDYLYGCMC